MAMLMVMLMACGDLTAWGLHLTPYEARLQLISKDLHCRQFLVTVVPVFPPWSEKL